MKSIASLHPVTTAAVSVPPSAAITGATAIPGSRRAAIEHSSVAQPLGPAAAAAVAVRSEWAIKTF